ncbi:hypothetical protein G6O67_007348 [Ophiocordyceps sinensis]|uniref:RxLR effector protein n=2 Tax=Ophiocordyceps sinensis TaxID=72228 RepID=A0A8H4LUM1_9HYPO|nr:hypothetical protein OCS_05218 [Ophiocordyceps sinensis CO18]KAF4505392.1 hypothetical protein G6O67_007348 [Ophiocordyceps sinensis]
MKLSFAAGLLAAFAGVAFAAPTDTVAQIQRRNVDVSQVFATPDLAQLDSQRLSHSVVELNGQTEKRDVSQQEGRPIKFKNLFKSAFDQFHKIAKLLKHKTPKKTPEKTPKNPPKNPSITKDKRPSSPTTLSKHP